MASRELLRKAVADFFGVDLSQIGPSFSLMGRHGQGSITRAALDAAIRKQVGLRSQVVYKAKTYGELEAALIPVPDLNGAAAPAESAPRAASAAPAAGGGLSCGVDVELVESLPAAADYWEHEFYRANFTPAEIAYCLRQSSPPLHFAGRWCAKEALKKCDADFLHESMSALELISDEGQAPHLNHYIGGRAHRLPHAVSISHTPHAAVAVIIKADHAADATAWGPAIVSPAVTAPRSVAEQPPSSAFRLMKSAAMIFALGLALLALLQGSGDHKPSRPAPHWTGARPRVLGVNDRLSSSPPLKDRAP